MCILIILSIKLFRLDTYLLNKSRDNYLNDHILVPIKVISLTSWFLFYKLYQ